MARTNNLTNFLADVANAIRNKKGTSETILAKDFDTEIENIQAGGADFEINDCRYLFYNNIRINIINDLLSLLKNVTDTSSMFYGCNQLTTLNVSNFDTSNVTNMFNMFYGCNQLTTLDVSNFNTSKVTNMSSMFYGCNQLTTLDVSNFNTSKVTNMGSMFYGCNQLTTLDVSNFDTSKVTYMFYMFNGCRGLTTLIINNPNIFNLLNTNAFSSTPIANGTGYIYVPDNLVNGYKSHAVWSTFANQIKPISELVGYSA